MPDVDVRASNQQDERQSPVRNLNPLAVAVLLALPLAAQPFPGGGWPPRPPHESFAEHKAADYARRFELTDSQRDQALQIFQNADRDAKPVEDRLEQAQRALREATRRNASPAEIDQLAAAFGTLVGQLEAINAKADMAFFNTLTAKQREIAPRGPRGFKGPPPPRPQGRPGPPPPPPNDKD